jgi:hypothetical protein
VRRRSLLLLRLFTACFFEMAEMDLHPAPRAAKHAAPQLKSVDFALQYSYRPSPSGIDSNLLILFHGLGTSLIASKTLQIFAHLLLYYRRHLQAFRTARRVSQSPTNRRSEPASSRPCSPAGKGSLVLVAIL